MYLTMRCWFIRYIFRMSKLSVDETKVQCPSRLQRQIQPYRQGPPAFRRAFRKVSLFGAIFYPQGPTARTVLMYIVAYLTKVRVHVSSFLFQFLGHYCTFLFFVTMIQLVLQNSLVKYLDCDELKTKQNKTKTDSPSFPIMLS